MRVQKHPIVSSTDTRVNGACAIDLRTVDPSVSVGARRRQRQSRRALPRSALPIQTGNRAHRRLLTVGSARGTDGLYCQGREVDRYDGARICRYPGTSIAGDPRRSARRHGKCIRLDRYGGALDTWVADYYPNSPGTLGINPRIGSRRKASGCGISWGFARFQGMTHRGRGL